MSYHKLDPGDKDVLDLCPECDEGYMVPTRGNWYQCSECGFEAEMDDYGNYISDSK